MIYDDLTVKKAAGIERFPKRYPDPKPLEYDNVVDIGEPSEKSFADLLRDKGVDPAVFGKIREERQKKNNH